MKTEDWFRKFADEIEHNGHLKVDNYEVYATCIPENTWEKPEGIEHLIRTALRSPHIIRVARRRITISGPGGTFSYPEPIREEPDRGHVVFMPDTAADGDCMCIRVRWKDDPSHRNSLAHGRVHNCASAAREHAEAEVRATGFEP